MRAKKGQAMIESVFVIPVIIILILVILQFGLITTALIVTKYSSFCVARYGCVYSAKNDPQGKHFERRFFIQPFPIFRFGWTLVECDTGIGFFPAQFDTARIIAALPLTAVSVEGKNRIFAGIPDEFRFWLRNLSFAQEIYSGNIHEFGKDFLKRYSRTLELVEARLYLDSPTEKIPVAIGEVTYHYRLIVPLVNRMLGYLPIVRDDPFTKINKGLYYFPLKAKTALVIYYSKELEYENE